MPTEITLPEIQPCEKCGNKYPTYAMGYDRNSGFYIRCVKCEKRVFTDDDINVVRRELLRLSGKDVV